MTAAPRCAPFTEWQHRQGPHLLRSPDGAEVWVNWSNESGGWWAPPVMARAEPAHAAGWRYIGLPLTAAEATAMVRARDALAAKLQAANKKIATLQARVAELEWSATA